MFPDVVVPVTSQGMKWFVFRALVGCFLCFGVSSFAQSPPINDNFEDRIVLTGNPVTFTGTLANATLQLDEGGAYYPYDADASVWWSWTAPGTGPTTLEVLDYSTNTLKLGWMDVRTGTNLWVDANVTSKSLNTGRHPFVTFSATAGTAYHLRVIGTNYGDFTLRITQTDIPLITLQPASRTVTTNQSTYFGVVAAGAQPFSYQWRFNGVDLPGETFPILILDHLITNQAGNYSVVVSNQAGGIVSEDAVLKVTETVEPPQLMAVGNSAGGFEFKILGDVGRIYRIESSTNLTDWTEEKSFPAEFVFYETARPKNGLVFSGTNRFSVPRSSQRKFYRATPYVPADEVCINNMRVLRFAKEIFAHQHYGYPYFVDIRPYFNYPTVFCPLDPKREVDVSYFFGDPAVNPVCWMSTAHLLEEPEE
jgi:hypothetical protein